MRILHVINSLATGGAEKLILESLPLFNQEGIICDLALIDDNDYPFKQKLQEEASCKIISLSKKKRSVYNPIFIFKLIPLLAKYDLVHVHLFPAQYFTALAKVLSFSKTKLIFTEHNTTNRRLDNPSFTIIERFIYRQYAKIICISPKVKESLINKLNLPTYKLEVFENGVDLRQIERAIALDRALFFYKKSDCLLIMVAGFRKQKDQDTVIRALKHLPDNYHLILVGDGERKEELCDLVSELRLTSRVNFLGIRSDVYGLIKMANVAILSSHWEGFGLAAVEAMAAGIPVIASNVDGLAQVVSGGGLLFEKQNEDDLSEKILTLANDITFQKKLNMTGLDKSKMYDISLLVTRSIALYKNVLNG